jgi:hypothetical protein
MEARIRAEERAEKAPKPDLNNLPEFFQMTPELARAGYEAAEMDRLEELRLAREETFTLGAALVPFVPVGVPSACPGWFDDVEMVCASILNLESCHNENLIQSVFPQLVMPTGLISEIMQQANCSYEAAIAMARGLNYPILEPAESKGLTRYLQPNAADLEAIPREIARRRADLFEIVGMALSRDSKQVESAEAKRLGLLDVSAVLAQRAEILQTAETAAVEVARRLDPSFAAYAPVYPIEFDVGDLKGDLENLLLISTTTLPEGSRRELMKAFISKLGRIGKVPAERLAQLLEEADAEELAPELGAFAGRGRPPAAG